jgi:hypothetical protein
MSIGTLQLSMRCSSIHLRPRRSFPVSVRGAVAEIAVGGSGGAAFCAVAGNAREIPNNAASDLWSEPLGKNRMNGLANPGAVDGRELETG